MFWISGGRGGRKLDDVREKYQRACRRLHLVHNEYVLLIAEAQESEKDFQTVMMPAFMQHHQQELENIIADWLVNINLLRRTVTNCKNGYIYIYTLHFLTLKLYLFIFYFLL